MTTPIITIGFDQQASSVLESTVNTCPQTAHNRGSWEAICAITVFFCSLSFPFYFQKSCV